MGTLLGPGEIGSPAPHYSDLGLGRDISTEEVQLCSYTVHRFTAAALLTTLVGAITCLTPSAASAEAHPGLRAELVGAIATALAHVA